MIGILLLHFNLATQVLLGGSSVGNVAMDEQYLIAHDVDATTGRNYTLDIPIGGRMEFSTITIPNGVILKFRRNQMNDPVHLLAKGDVTVAGTIDVSGATGTDASGGAGGPGGYDGGAPGFLATPGDGHGPGGGKATAGDQAYIRRAASHAALPTSAGRTGGGAVYGNASCFPLIGGSGGAGADDRGGGGGGGGAILIGSETTLTVSGAINARGGSYANTSAGAGAGGCIRLVAKKVVLTSGSLDVRFSTDSYSPGYIRIDSIFRDQVLNLSGSDPAYTVGSNMVVRLDDMPSIRTLSANGEPRADNDDEPIVVVVPAQTAVPIVVEITNFSCGVELEVMAVPASGAATKTSYVRYNGTHDFSVPIPANTATSIEVYGKAQTCVN